MPLNSFNQLYQDADAQAPSFPIAVVGGAERTVLEALRTACDRRWVEPLVVGQASAIRQVAADCNVDLHGFTIVEAEDSTSMAVAQARSGRARMLMKGQIATPL